MLLRNRPESHAFGAKNISSNRSIETQGEGDSLQENWGMFYLTKVEWMWTTQTTNNHYKQHFMTVFSEVNIFLSFVHL